jgi:glutathione S-transferase
MTSSGPVTWMTRRDAGPGSVDTPSSLVLRYRHPTVERNGNQALSEKAPTLAAWMARMEDRERFRSTVPSMG